MPTFDNLEFSSDYQFNFSNSVLHQLEMQQRRLLYKKRPDLWARDILGVILWSRQVEVCFSIVNHHDTMVAACHASGKSFLTAVLICWWIDVHPIGEARVLSTAPTTAQVRGIVWREVQKLHKLSRDRYQEYCDAKKRGESTQGLPDHCLPGYITSSATWRNFDGLELGSGRTPPRGREGDAFQGIHGGVFAIADEAVGVSADMIGTLGNNTTADDDRMLMIANPTNPLSEMGQIWNDPKRASRWSRVTISALDSPNLTDEGKSLPQEMLKNIVGPAYIEKMKLAYGEESANYISRVLGRWALDSGQIIFTDDVLEVGLATTVIPDPDDPIHVGFDVARSPKGDWSYLYTAQEGWVYKTHDWVKDPEDPTGESYNEVELEKPIKTDRRGIKLRYLDRWRGLEFFPLYNDSGNRKTSQAANERANMHMRSLNATQLRIDADGMGAQMVDAMFMENIPQPHGYTIVRMKGNDPSPDRNGWYNQRAYQYMELGQRMRRGEVDIEKDDGGDRRLLSELGGIEYKFAAGLAESILILSKRELRDRGMSSPDEADSALYAAALVDIEGLEPEEGEFSIDLEQFVGQGGASSFYNNPW